MTTLHEAIVTAICFDDGLLSLERKRCAPLVERVDASVVAWLSVVSEGEIQAAARAIWLSDLSDHHGVTHEAADCFARAALAASRGVRLPKETP